jgi:hypothetical protein
MSAGGAATMTTMMMAKRTMSSDFVDHPTLGHVPRCRAVVYDRIGSGTHRCFWCGSWIAWKLRAPLPAGLGKLTVCRHRGALVVACVRCTKIHSAVNAPDEVDDPMGEIRSSVRTFERPVHPLGILVDVALNDVLVEWEASNSYTPCGSNLQQVADAIAEDRVFLEVVSVKDLLLPEWGKRLEMYRNVWGRSPHETLRCHGALYLEALGKEPVYEPHYSAGIADLKASDGSLFVECGTIREDKITIAMESGQCVMVIPYGLGCRIRSAPDAAIICGRGDIPPNNSFERYQLLGGIILGYIFSPRVRPELVEVPRQVRSAEETQAAVGIGAPFTRMRRCKKRRRRRRKSDSTRPATPFCSECSKHPRYRAICDGLCALHLSRREAKKAAESAP